jgi:hypothetical protein
VRLGGPALQFGLTLHTAWLPAIAPSTGGYYVDPRKDYGPTIAWDPDLKKFFEDVVYPPHI